MAKKIILFLVIILVILGAVYWVTKRESKPPVPDTNFNYSEVIKSTISTNGGVIQNADKSVSVTFPPLQQPTEFTLSFKKSNFAVKTGVSSPVTITIAPDTDLSAAPTPISIKVKYDEKYSLPVPYLVDENGKLHSVDTASLDTNNHYFTASTFHGGDYSWIYAE